MRVHLRGAFQGEVGKPARSPPQNVSTVSTSVADEPCRGMTREPSQLAKALLAFVSSIRERGTALLTPQEMSSDICLRVMVVLIAVCITADICPGY